MKILIVDDELLVRVGLKSSIDWQQYGMEIVGEAENGVQALEQIRYLEPDIIFLDIKMPGMSGIDVMKRMKDENLKGKVIILSSFDDFELVKEAMKLGALEYIHKPRMRSEDIIEILKEIRDDAQLSYFLTDKTLMEDSIRRLIDGEAYNKQNIGIKGPCFSCLVFSVSNYHRIKQRYKDSDTKILESSIINILGEVLSNYEDIQILHYDRNLYVILIGFNNIVSQQKMLSRLDEISRLVKDALKKFLDIELYIGISDIVNNYENIHMAFMQAYKAHNLNFYAQGSSVVRYGEIKNRDDGKIKKIDGAVEELKAYIVRNDMDSFKSHLMALTDLLQDTKALSEEKVKRIFNGFIFLIKDSSSSLQEMDRINQCETLKDLNDTFDSIIGNYICNRDNLNKNQTSNYLIKKAIRYISDNYNKDISLNALSDNLNISPSYISRLFKEEMNQGLFDYINEFRIEKAKQLLKDPELKVYEVSTMVGFKSAVHFNIVFNKYIGMSPTQYRQQYMQL
ncbi:response regulator transcription factor [Xylanivirga thermophila]|uniref:response regulator transcription factor n=1 Tax=Xylanivirga thermophila TaxID=2496273 RepID=UPI00101B9285|nr:response regulator [Xylanivirga thermophila]